MFSSSFPICPCWTSVPKTCPAQTTRFVFKIKPGPPQGITKLQESWGETGREGKDGQRLIPPCHNPGSWIAISLALEARTQLQHTGASVVWAAAAAKQ